MSTSIGATARSHVDGRGLRVLLVDDHADTLYVFSKLLRQRGFDVEAASTVASALPVASSPDIDLLILDLGLPDGTGWDLMMRVREQRDVVGIAVSGLCMDSDLRRSEESGFIAHVPKPVVMRDLDAALDDAVARIRRTSVGATS